MVKSVISPLKTSIIGENVHDIQSVIVVRPEKPRPEKPLDEAQIEAIVFTSNGFWIESKPVFWSLISDVSFKAKFKKNK